MNKSRKYIGNWPESVRKAAKYSVRYDRETKKRGVGVIIETRDDEIWRPVNTNHDRLVNMVMAIKKDVEGNDSGGTFYINEFRQVIVPAGRPVQYYYAGEYDQDLIFELEDGIEISGRPHDLEGNFLKPGDEWTGPHPGIPYVLEAGGKDIRYEIQLSAIKYKRVKLSRLVGPDQARVISQRIARVKDTAGGRFYINEFRAIFAPITEEDGRLVYRYCGTLSEKDPWFPRGTWEEAEGDAQNGSPTPAIPATLEKGTEKSGHPEMEAVERTVSIETGKSGYSYDTLFGPYLPGASEVFLQDPYIKHRHQLANFQRFCELLVRVGDCRKIHLRSHEAFGEDLDEANATLETLKRSLKDYEIELSWERDNHVHDREIQLNNGWRISLGRGLDIYQKPDSWKAIGASDFNLRPCHETKITFVKDNNAAEKTG